MGSEHNMNACLLLASPKYAHMCMDVNFAQIFSQKKQTEKLNKNRLQLKNKKKYILFIPYFHLKNKVLKLLKLFLRFSMQLVNLP